MITVLSFGGGQDSTAILLKIIYDKDFREKYVKGKLLVLMANTFNEHPKTYIHVAKIKKLCEKNNIFFELIDLKGYTSEIWAKGKNGFQYCTTDIPHTITKNKEDLKTQKL